MWKKLLHKTKIEKINYEVHSFLNIKYIHVVYINVNI